MPSNYRAIKHNFFLIFCAQNHDVHNNSFFENYKYNMMYLKKIYILYIRISISQLNIEKGIFFK